MYIVTNMSIRILWRSTVFLITIVFIYLAFPILIVPSSLPAIKALFIEQESTQNYNSDSPNYDLEPSTQTANPKIYEVNIETVLTPKQKLQAIKDIHQQGIDLILARN